MKNYSINFLINYYPFIYFYFYIFIYLEMKKKTNFIKCKKKNEKLKDINQICILKNLDFIYFNGGFLYYCDFKTLKRAFGKQLFISIHNICLINDSQILCSHSRNQFSLISIINNKDFNIDKTIIVEDNIPIETFYSIELKDKNILSYSINKMKIYDMKNYQNITSILFPFEIMNIYEIEITNELLLTYKNSIINFLNMNLFIFSSNPIEIKYIYKYSQNICQITKKLICIGYKNGFALINIFNHSIINKINVSYLNITNIINISSEIFIIRSEPQHKLVSTSIIFFYKINNENNECIQIHKDLIDSEIKSINYLSSNLLLIISTDALKIIEFELNI